MSVDPAPRPPYRPQPRDLTRPPTSSFTSNMSVFWMITMGALAAALLIWAFGVGNPQYTSDTNSGPSTRTLSPDAAPEDASKTQPAP